MLRLHCPYFHVRIFLLQYLADSCDGPSGSDSGTKTVNRTLCLLQDFHSCLVSVDSRVSRVFKLLRHKDPGVFPGHFQGRIQTFLYTFSDISGVMDQDHFRSIMLHQLSPFFTYRIRHDDPGLIAPDSSHQSQTDPLVAAGGFHNDSVLFYEPFFFGVFYHVICSPGFNRTAYIQSFKFHKDLGASLLCHPIQTDQRRISHCFKNIMIDHFISHTFPKFMFQRVSRSCTHL